MELDEREGSVEHHKRLRTLWVAWEADVRMCVGSRGRKAPSLSRPGVKGFGPSCRASTSLLAVFIRVLNSEWLVDGCS